MHQKKSIAMIIFIHLRNGNYQMNFILKCYKKRLVLSHLQPNHLTILPIYHLIAPRTSYLASHIPHLCS